MREGSMKYAVALLTLGLSISNAEALVGTPTVQEAIRSDVIPAAMCGFSCRGGGRYIPGPPGVCAANGLIWCGPTVGPRIGPPIGPRFREGDVYGRPGGCRTITIEREDGSVRTIRRCD